MRADQKQALEGILHNPAIWRAEQWAQGARAGLPSGHAQLDQALPDGGWPAAALTELLSTVTGSGEVLLLAPALRAAAAEGRGIALLAPPWLPQAQAWAATGIPLERLLVVQADGVDLLWSAEQVLRSGECGAVLLWGQAAGRALNQRALQRLQLAAAAGNSACFLYRAANTQDAPSPAPLRVLLAAQDGALQLRILKCRGAWRREVLRLSPLPAHWQEPAPAAPAAAAPSVVERPITVLPRTPTAAGSAAQVPSRHVRPLPARLV